MLKGFIDYRRCCTSGVRPPLRQEVKLGRQQQKARCIARLAQLHQRTTSALTTDLISSLKWAKALQVVLSGPPLWCAVCRTAVGMSQDCAVAPATQLELDELQHQFTDVPPDSPPYQQDYASDEDDPCSHSFTPSLDLMEMAKFSSEPCTPAPQQQHTWSVYSGNIFDDQSPIEAQLCGLTIGDRFICDNIIGRGSFGFTFKALDKVTGKEVAVKTAKGRHTHNQNASYNYDEFLLVEWTAYQRIMAADAAPPSRFPDMLAAGIQHFAPDLDDDRPSFMISFMAMELLGSSIWDAANHMRMHQQVPEHSEAWSDDELDSQTAHESPLEPSTAWVVQTGKGMLQALADVHRRGYIHRDVKTENFCLDTSGSNDSIKVVDFGFACLAYGYYSFRDDYHTRCASFWGTPNYASLSALMSYPQAPRDDLECLVYCLFEMSHPTLRLPWNRTLTTNKEAKEGWSTKQLEHMSKKKRAAWQLACKQGEVPKYLMGYFDYITSLGPQDIPDYEWLLMQLDSGATGKVPTRLPARRQLADWPSPGDLYSRKDYAVFAISQVAHAASKILPQASSVSAGVDAAAAPGGSKRTYADMEDQGAMSDQGQHVHKRSKGLGWPAGELSETEVPDSQCSPACVEIESKLLALGGQGGKHVGASPGTAKHSLRLLEDSQAEE